MELSRSIIKAKVLLPSLAPEIDRWNQKWNDGLSNDPYPYGYNWAESENFTVSYIKCKTINNPLLRKLYQYFILPIKALNSDAIWTHYEADAFKIALLKKMPFIKRFIPKQVACFIWLADNFQGYSRWKRRIVRWLIKEIEQIVYLAPTESIFFSNVLGLPDNKHGFVPFGINLDSYCEGPMEKVEGLDFPFLLSLGNDVHRDIDTLEDLANRLDGKIKVVFATRNGEFIKRLSNNKNIVVVSVDLKQVRWLYKQCSFVILPLLQNQHASGCTTMLEAAVNKKAVLATKTPGLDAYIANHSTGYLIEQNQNDEFYDKIIYLLQNTDALKRMGEQAERFVRTGAFTSKDWAQTHVRLTKQLLSIKGTHSYTNQVEM